VTLPWVLALGSLVASSPTSLGPPADLRPPAELTRPGGVSRGPFAIRYEPFGDPAIAAFAAAAWATTELITKDVLASRTCRLCDRDLDGVDRLNGLDRWARGAQWGSETQRTANMLSHLGVFAVLPGAIVGMEVALAGANGQIRLASEDLVVVMQTAALALLLNQSVKFIAARERPFVHALPAAEREATEDPLDNNMSFFSGHTTFAFATAVAAGTLAELRSYHGRQWVWAVGLPLAAASGYLRMAADKHYLTDVLVGAAVGAAFGVGIPLLFHPRQDPTAAGVEIRVVPSSGGVALSGTF
jgi:membrane-associated phospholipid phosphatase